MKNKIIDLPYSEFKNLVDFLTQLGQPKNTEIVGKKEVSNFVNENIAKFFPSLTAVQSMEMAYLTEHLSEESYNEFKNKYPDIYVDVTGKSKPEEKRYWEITLETLETIYGHATSNHNTILANQVETAKYLKNLCFDKVVGYVAIRKKYMETYPELFTKEDMKLSEEFLTEYFGEKKKTNAFFAVIFNTISKKKWNHFSIFVDHLFRRLECAYAEYSESKKLDNPVNIEFMKNVEEAVKQYFINVE